MTAVKKLYVLLCGYEIVPRSVCLRGGGDRFVMSVPICAYLLETAQGFVLFDAGFDAAVLRDAELRARRFTDHGWEPPVVWPQHDLLAQLDGIGVAPEEVQHLVLSHAHFDHTGHVKSFPKAKVWMQRAEFPFAFDGPERPGVMRADIDGPDVDWMPVAGDVEIVTGLTLLATHGHTPGHQSALVSLPKSGPAILVGDVGDWLQNFDEEILPGEAADDAAALESIRKINRIRHERNAAMFVCHDPVLIQQQKLSPRFYD